MVEEGQDMEIEDDDEPEYGYYYDEEEDSIKYDSREVQAMRKVYVGAIRTSTTQQDFYSYFKRFGEITDHIIIQDPVTLESKGFGFVTYVKSDSVEKMLKKRPHRLDGKFVEVKRAMPREFNDMGAHAKTSRLFLSGFKNIVLEPVELKQYIDSRHSDYGRLISIQLAIDKVTRASKGYGYLECSSTDFADRLLISENTFQLKGATLSIKKREQIVGLHTRQTIGKKKKKKKKGQQQKQVEEQAVADMKYEKKIVEYLTYVSPMRRKNRKDSRQSKSPTRRKSRDRDNRRSRDRSRRSRSRGRDRSRRRRSKDSKLRSRSRDNSRKDDLDYFFGIGTVQDRGLGNITNSAQTMDSLQQPGLGMVNMAYRGLPALGNQLPNNGSAKTPLLPDSMIPPISGTYPDPYLTPPITPGDGLIDQATYERLYQEGINRFYQEAQLYNQAADANFPPLGYPVLAPGMDNPDNYPNNGYLDTCNNDYFNAPRNNGYADDYSRQNDRLADNADGKYPSNKDSYSKNRHPSSKEGYSRDDYERDRYSKSSPQDNKRVRKEGSRSQSRSDRRDIIDLTKDRTSQEKKDQSSKSIDLTKSSNNTTERGRERTHSKGQEGGKKDAPYSRSDWSRDQQKNQGDGKGKEKASLEKTNNTKSNNKSQRDGSKNNMTNNGNSHLEHNKINAGIPNETTAGYNEGAYAENAEDEYQPINTDIYYDY